MDNVTDDLYQRASGVKVRKRWRMEEVCSFSTIDGNLRVKMDGSKKKKKKKKKEQTECIRSKTPVKSTNQSVNLFADSKASNKTTCILGSHF